MKPKETITERMIVIKIEDICRFMDSFAPVRLAESWDNVGLLVGDFSASADRIMTCLTITPESVDEAIEKNVDLIVAHHPLPFRPFKRLTTDSPASKMLWDLVRAGVSIYSPHTAFDSAGEGINQSLAGRFGMTDIEPMILRDDDPQGLGAGRVGVLENAVDLKEFSSRIKSDFSLNGLRLVGDLTNSVRKIGVACGSGGSFLGDVRRAECDTFVTGEATFHTCLEAKAFGITLVLLGHYSSERFAVEFLAERIGDKFPDADVWVSTEESDPIDWV